MTLEDRLGSLLIAISELRSDIANENIQRDLRIRSSERAIFWSRVANGVAGLVALAAVFVGFSARADLHSSLRNTASQRIASCVQYNRQQVEQRNAEKSEIRQLTSLAQAGQLAAVKKFLADYDATVDKAHTPRDCTAAGIEKYLDQP